MSPDPSGGGDAPATPFSPVDARVSFADQEERTLDFWREREVFRRSVEDRPDAPIFSFYEGPPTANGNPGIHHVLARVFKDLIPRYQTMRGYRVPRKGGWDTHGLPVELEVEKQLGLSSKQEIETYGVERFNQQCRDSVFTYVSQWERLTDRIGYWIDTDDAYVTYHPEYVESGWWVFKQLWDHDLMFRDYRVTPHCPRCETSLSSHEIAQGYREQTPDPSVTVRFPLTAARNPDAPAVLRLRDGVPTAFLAWTTTPWTLAGNTALAIAPEATYALVEVERDEQTERVIVAAALQHVAGDEARVLETLRGSDLTGLRYEPLYEAATWPGLQPRAFVDGHTVEVAPDDFPPRRVVPGDFVGVEDGTGIVHIAPAFGEDDYRLGREHGLGFLQPVTLDGSLLGGPAEGLFAKDGDPLITRDLKERGLMWEASQILHTYPFCWRCGTAVLYYAKPSWYIRTTAVADRLAANNRERIEWVPDHIRDGRFGEWLEGNVDWAVSRERYWGTPIPIWVCDRCNHAECVGSYESLATLAGLAEPPPDPHRPYIDEVQWACTAGGCDGTMRRTPEVADGWFDSGAMPYAQWHYPFENEATFNDRFPADFICEAIDQTRGWFYTLHALATLLHHAGAVPDGVAYTHVICLGHILDGEGLKMSKSRGNVVDPFSVLDRHGADAVRWYMYTAAPPGNSRRFSEDLVGETSRRFLSTLWNTYSFFVTYANIADFDPAAAAPESARTELDRWIRSELHRTVQRVTAGLDAYEPADAARPIGEFVDQLSNWYVRRSRRRFWKSDDSADTQAALHTLYECLTTITKLLAPFTPFVAESLYQNLIAERLPTEPDSVHLAAWPEADGAAIDEALSEEVATVQRMVSLGRGARSRAGVKVRQPLAEIVLLPRTAAERAALERLATEVADELNVRRVSVVADERARVTYELRPNLPVLGPRLGSEIGRVKAALAEADAAEVAARMRAGEPATVGEWELLPGEVLVSVTGIATADAEWAAAEDAGYVAVLNVHITPELAAAGLARDLIRSVQDLRRDAGLDVTDRIALTYDALDGADAAVDLVTAALTTHADEVAGEVLALSVTQAAPAAGAHTAEAKLGGGVVRFGIERA